MDNRVEISIYVVGGTVLPTFLIDVNDKDSVVEKLSKGEGTVTALNGMTVRASQVTAFQVLS